MLEKYMMMNQERQLVNTKKKVAAYCRVSTDRDDQANSFESQQRYFRQYIEHNPDWELFEVFADVKHGKGNEKNNNKKLKQQKFTGKYDFQKHNNA